MDIMGCLWEQEKTDGWYSTTLGEITLNPEFFVYVICVERKLFKKSFVGEETKNC